MGAPAGQVGAANPRGSREANEQQEEKQERSCRSGAPHGLPWGQSAQNMAAQPEGGQRALAVQQRERREQESSPLPAPAPPCPKAPPRS